MRSSHGFGIFEQYVFLGISYSCADFSGFHPTLLATSIITVI